MSCISPYLLGLSGNSDTSDICRYQNHQASDLLHNLPLKSRLRIEFLCSLLSSNTFDFSLQRSRLGCRKVLEENCQTFQMGCSCITNIFSHSYVGSYWGYIFSGSRYDVIVRALYSFYSNLRQSKLTNISVKTRSTEMQVFSNFILTSTCFYVAFST